MLLDFGLQSLKMKVIKFLKENMYAPKGLESEST